MNTLAAIYNNLNLQDNQRKNVTSLPCHKENIYILALSAHSKNVLASHHCLFSSFGLKLISFNVVLGTLPCLIC